MGYFPNATSWEFWASDNCFRCAHWPKTDNAPACPVELAHNLYSYELCNSEADPGKVILDLLIPPTKDGCGKCAMFQARNGLTDKHLRDWGKYKALMAEAEVEATPVKASLHEIVLKHTVVGGYPDTKAIARDAYALAIAMEAQRAETGTGSVHDSAAIAQPLVSPPSDKEQ